MSNIGLHVQATANQAPRGGKSLTITEIIRGEGGTCSMDGRWCIDTLRHGGKLEKVDEGRSGKFVGFHCMLPNK